MSSSYVGIFVCGTNRYKMFFDSFFMSAERHLFPGIKKKYFLVTDGVEPALCSHFPKQITPIIIDTAGMNWYDNIAYKWQVYSKIIEDLPNKNKYSEFVQYNINSLFAEDVNYSIIDRTKKLFCVEHPWYNKENPPYCANINSKAYIDKSEYSEYVMTSGIGGKPKYFSDLCNFITTSFNIDLKNGIKANWDDESYINRYYISNKEKIQLLSSDLNYPEEFFNEIYKNQASKYTPKVILLRKQLSFLMGDKKINKNNKDFKNDPPSLRLKYDDSFCDSIKYVNNHVSKSIIDIIKTKGDDVWFSLTHREGKLVGDKIKLINYPEHNSCLLSGIYN